MTVADAIIAIAIGAGAGVLSGIFGVGGGIEDLRPFEARAFARSLMGLAA